MLEEQQYKLTPTAESALLQYITLRKDQPLFANARSMKNALDRARMRQANRIFETDNNLVLTKSDLVTLDEQDIRQSRIFDLATPAAPANPYAAYGTPGYLSLIHI